jgi:hypothetical protein
LLLRRHVVLLHGTVLIRLTLVLRARGRRKGHSLRLASCPSASFRAEDGPIRAKSRG